VTGLRSAWKTTLPFEASVVSAASRWLVLEGHEHYAVLDAETGRVEFTRHKEPARPFAIAVHPTPSGALIEPTATGLQARDMATGAVRWRANDASLRLARTTRLATNGDVVAACDQSVVTALDDRSGATRWTADLRGCGVLLSDASRIYAEAREGLVALDARTGARLWAVATEHDVESPPFGAWVAATGGRVMLRGSPARRVAVLDAATGRRLRELTLPDTPVTSFATYGDLLLLTTSPGSDERNVVMFSLTTGEALWRRRTAAGTGYLLSLHAAYERDASGDRLRTLDPRSGRERGHQGAAVSLGVGEERPIAASMLTPIARADHDLAATSVVFVATDSDGRGGTVVDGLLESLALPIEEVMIEGQIDAAPCGGTDSAEGLRVRVGDAVVAADRHGRFRVTVRARGSIPIGPEPLLYDSGGEVVMNCQLEPRSTTLWLDGRRGAYEVSLRTHYFFFTDEID